ncbi:MAG: hypothetical protein ABFS18_12125 [Thermodesulfobacteriota bacterium]
MGTYETIILLYILFIWCVVLHTLEEIAQGVFDVKLGPIKASKKKYFIGATLITTVNFSTLALIVIGSKVGLYLGIFTSSVIGVLQALIHGYGFIKEGGKAKNVGVGFYSSIPLSIVGAILLYKILEQV